MLRVTSMVAVRRPAERLPRAELPGPQERRG